VRTWSESRGLKRSRYCVKKRPYRGLLNSIERYVNNSPIDRHVDRFIYLQVLPQLCNVLHFEVSRLVRLAFIMANRLNISYGKQKFSVSRCRWIHMKITQASIDAQLAYGFFSNRSFPIRIKDLDVLLDFPDLD